MAQTAPKSTGTPPRMVQGAVEAANEKGIKVGGYWFNYSQFNEVPHPEVGDTITMEVVKDRFIRALKIGGVEDDSEELAGDDVAGLQPQAQDGDEPNGSWGYGRGTEAHGRVAPPPTRAPAGGPQAQPQVATVGRSREHLRATAALAAATFLAGKPDLSTEDVLNAAEYLLAWITGKED